ncbi:MAG: DUF2793 domain-containing protein [Pseudomonadota bacterium]
MSETSQFNLPLLEAAQAQKHITVNEALSRLDALAQLRIQSLVQTSPPGSHTDGQCFAVPIGASGDWTGQDGKLAIFSNGGWEFVGPLDGWNAWVVDEMAEYRYFAGSWSAVAGGLSPDASLMVNQQPFGSATSLDLREVEHVISAGNTNDVSIVTPDYCWITAISYRVSEAIVMTGASSWRLGTNTNSTQFGSSLSTALNSVGFTATTKRFYFYPTTPIIRMQAGSGDFVSGKVRFAVHSICYAPPDAV